MSKKLIYLFFLSITMLIKASLIFHGTEDTLKTLKTIMENKKSGCYLRFGDGDINLAYGLGELCQPFNAQNIQKEMREAFALNGPTIIKTLPLYCKEFNGLEPYMFPGNHEVSYTQACGMVEKVRFLWGGSMQDIYSPCALAYAATHLPSLAVDFLKFLRSQNCLALVANENIPAHIRELLFGHDCVFIPTPAQDVFSQINRIELDCKKLLSQHNEYRVIVLSMGCSGRILAKRLWQTFDNIFIFDFGSLMDALCGWNSRAWIELTQFNKDQFLAEFSK
ncbi:MAG: hypothetical protein M1114_02350 [Candidatus Dependentiae bacterium]|nr:hypothetical protein [Candidatus Dependentiae bacterium]